MATRLDPEAYFRDIRTDLPRNCGAFLCGWVERVRGENPAPHVCEMDRRQWVPLLNSAGGLGALVGGIADEIAARPVGAAALLPGDLAVVDIPTSARRTRQACAIRDGESRWVLWARTGLMRTSFIHPSLIWRL